MIAFVPTLLALTAGSATATVVPLIYEQCTHQVLTEKAAQMSKRLAPFLEEAGFENDFSSTDVAPNGMPGGGSYILWANGAGKDKRVKVDGHTASHLIQAGAVLEDGTEHLDGQSEFTSKRSLNHFYDPTQTEEDPNVFSPGGVLGVAGSASPVWASGSGSNEYDWEDANNYLFQAIVAELPSDREAAMAKALVSLGCVVHLLQDCYQPSHVRADSHVCNHLDWGFFDSIVIDVSGCSLLEFGGKDIVRPDFVAPPVQQALAQATAVPKETLRRFFFPEPGSVQPSDGALWVAKNFFSDDTILEGDTPFQEDPCADEAYGYLRSLSDPSAALASKTPPGPIQSLLSGVLPGWSAESDYSLADHYCAIDLTAEGTFGVGEVVLDNLKVLLPPAAGQSSALIDYFFRSQLEASLDPDTGRIEVDLPPGAPVIHSASFRVLVEDGEGMRDALPEVPPQTLGPLQPGQPLLLEGDVQSHVNDLSEPTFLVVVADGEIGAGRERGIAVARFEAFPLKPVRFEFLSAENVFERELVFADAFCLTDLWPIDVYADTCSGYGERTGAIHALNCIGDYVARVRLEAGGGGTPDYHTAGWTPECGAGLYVASAGVLTELLVGRAPGYSLGTSSIGGASTSVLFRIVGDQGGQLRLTGKLSAGPDVNYITGEYHAASVGGGYRIAVNGSEVKTYEQPIDSVPVQEQVTIWEVNEVFAVEPGDELLFELWSDATLVLLPGDSTEQCPFSVAGNFLVRILPCSGPGCR